MEDFNKIYKQYSPIIKWIIGRSIQNPDVVKDLTQMVFIKAFENMNSYDPAKATVNTWLTCITKNTLIDYYRSSERNFQVSYNEVVLEEDGNEIEFHNRFESSQVYNPEVIMTAKETVNNIVDYLKTLPKLKQRIGICRFINDMPIHEIAEELNVPIGTVKSYTKQIKELLQFKFAA
jgi:RNA polymerase sigma-70 factor (ECF subfamily)